MIGIDIVDIRKFEEKKLLMNIFTENELVYAKSKANSNQTLAGILASKEAVVKALDLKLSAIIRKKVEIQHQENKPILYINGEKNLADISISHDGDYAVAVCRSLIDLNVKVDNEIASLLKKRHKASHKGDYGRIAVLGGSSGMAGSVYMASLASLRAGAGLSYIIAPQSISHILQIKANEQIIREIDCDNFYYEKQIIDQILEEISDKDVLAIGPGMAKGHGIDKLIGTIVEKSDINLVIDADGLNALSKNPNILNKRKNIILTPHLKEFERLSGLSIAEINKDRENIAKDFAKKYDIILVLKSENTIVTDGERIYINQIGNPGMATAGSGDVLTGIIASFLKIQSPYEAAVLGVYVHSLAGDLASLNIGEDSIIATDIINHISDAIKLLRQV